MLIAHAWRSCSRAMFTSWAYFSLASSKIEQKKRRSRYNQAATEDFCKAKPTNPANVIFPKTRPERHQSPTTSTAPMGYHNSLHPSLALSAAHPETKKPVSPETFTQNRSQELKRNSQHISFCCRFQIHTDS